MNKLTILTVSQAMHLIYSRGTYCRVEQHMANYLKCELSASLEHCCMHICYRCGHIIATLPLFMSLPLSRVTLVKGWFHSKNLRVVSVVIIMSPPSQLKVPIFG